MTIDLANLIEALSRPQAYPHAVDSVEVHQTHISVVFLAGPFAYKIKKPVNLGFLDFSTLEKRKHFCEEEVRLNRRLAPHIYLGVVPITHFPPLPTGGEGPGVRGNSPPPSSSPDLHVSGCGPVVEWAVQMKRLPGDATLEQHLIRGDVTREQLRAIAQRVAAFHHDAESGPHIAAFGRFDVVAQNARENFVQAAPLVGATVSPIVFERVRALTEAHLTRYHDLMEARAERGVPRDTHGDLRLDHVYLFSAEAPPNDLVIIDCIEFADRFRFADPVADMAFLAMDLAFHGRRDLARAFADSYLQEAGDAEGRALLPFYSAYRAVVRAKVEGMELSELEIEPAERRHAQQRARAHWLVALGELEKPAKRPALVLMAGLPGSGKSTLARAIAESARFQVLRSDVVRKELAGAAPAHADFGAGIYTPAWTGRTYAELLKRAEDLLWQGERVIIDANFRDDAWRRKFLDAAGRWGVPFLFVQCTTSPEVARARLQARQNDASDADWNIYEQLAESWQPASDGVARLMHRLDTSGALADNVGRLQDLLRMNGLLGPLQ